MFADGPSFPSATYLPKNLILLNFKFKIMIRKIIALILILIAITTASAETIYCDNCSDCSMKIENANFSDIVMLTADISGNSEDCICFNGNDGITFDGDGYTINDSDRGIYLSSHSNNNTVRNVTLTNFWYGVHLVAVSNNIVENVSCATSTISGRGVYVYESDHNLFRNVNISGIYQGALQLSGSDYNAIDNSDISNNYNVGVYITNSDHNVLNNSYIMQNNGDGIWIVGESSYNLIYNNWFENADNVYVNSDYTNTWNVTNRTANNIIGGKFIGGNYWSDYGGWHTRPAGFGYEPYVIDENNTDYLPLVIKGEPAIWIRNAGYDIEVGGTFEYLVTCRNGSNMDVNCTNLTWNSSNETVGTVVWSADDAAIITGHAVGVTNITVSGSGNLTDTIAQNVTGMCGDVDSDYSVTINDVVDTYFRVINPSYPLECEWCADVDNDSSITINDVVEIYYRVIDPSYPLNCSD